LVAAFESVGSILVIAMLIAPAATAYLLTDRLKTMIGLSLVIAAASAVLGHVSAITLPKIVFSRLGFDTIEDASTAGMMAAACGCLFVCAALFGPRHGVISKLFDRFRVRIRIASEDVLGLLYRFDERQISEAESANLLIELLGAGPIVRRFAIRSLIRQGLADPTGVGMQLTDSGRDRAKKLVRSHRLWESYMRKHFTVPDDHLHDMAERVEHFIEEDMRAELAAELDGLETDPHGRVIPSEDEMP
jgi:manganese/zinc/iron transport system permease protein